MLNGELLAMEFGSGSPCVGFCGLKGVFVVCCFHFGFYRLALMLCKFYFMREWFWCKFGLRTLAKHSHILHLNSKRYRTSIKFIYPWKFMGYFRRLFDRC